MNFLLIPDEYWGIITLYQEARSEPYNGLIAVAEVIRNRIKSKFFSDGTVRGTVLRPYQFSGWNTSDPNRIVSSSLKLNDGLTNRIIQAWIESENTNLTQNAVNYHAEYLAPEWSKSPEFIKTVQIGRHIFYKRREI